MNLARTHAATIDVRTSSAALPAALVLVALVSACAPVVRPSSPAAPGGPPPETHATDPASTSEEPADTTDPASSPAHLTVTPGPPFTELHGWMTDDHGAALE